MASSQEVWPLLFLTLTLTQRGVWCSLGLAVIRVNETLTAEEVIVRFGQRIFQQGRPWGGFLIEGDVIKPLQRNSITSETRKWEKSPDGTVKIPYEISQQYDEVTRNSIRQGFGDFEKFTCVRFVPREDEEDFISIQPLQGCYSSVGRVGGMQLLSLKRQCLEQGRGVVEHELMHSLGFWHEHARRDRDKFIKIQWKNVWPGYEHNFLKKNTNNMKSKYDYGSILHYSRSAFSKNGQPTLKPLLGTQAMIGQRVRLSEMDLLKVNRLYDCSTVNLLLNDNSSQCENALLAGDTHAMMGRQIRPLEMDFLRVTGPYNCTEN